MDTLVPNSPAVFGINWYPNFDEPERIGRTWWIGRGSLGSIRGGHSIAGLHHSIADVLSWWAYYDQHQEGRCVEFATHRMLSLLNRRRYDILSRWLYWEAQKRDPWPGGSYPDASPQYEGTDVRAALEVVMDRGPRRQYTGGRLSDPMPQDGISAFRWATTWDEVRKGLGVPDWKDGVTLANSWGTDYPRKVRITDEAGARLLEEDGECAFVTDR